ncbi:MAG: sodium:proton antiporter [Candidatus Binatia bacterium]
MTLSVLYAFVGVITFVIGLHGLLFRPHLLRKIIAFNIMASGTALVLIASAWRGQQAPPDPVPHALVLTGIVVAVSATAFALALTSRIHELTGHACLPEDISEPADRSR